MMRLPSLWIDNHLHQQEETMQTVMKPIITPTTRKPAPTANKPLLTGTAKVFHAVAVFFWLLFLFGVGLDVLLLLIALALHTDGGLTLADVVHFGKGVAVTSLVVVVVGLLALSNDRIAHNLDQL